MNNVKYPKGYLSVIEGETHLAIHKYKLSEYRKMSLENLNKLYDEVNNLIGLVEKLSVKEF